MLKGTSGRWIMFRGHKRWFVGEMLGDGSSSSSHSVYTARARRVPPSSSSTTTPTGRDQGETNSSREMSRSVREVYRKFGDFGSPKRFRSDAEGLMKFRRRGYNPEAAGSSSSSSSNRYISGHSDNDAADVRGNATHQHRVGSNRDFSPPPPQPPGGGGPTHYYDWSISTATGAYSQWLADYARWYYDAYFANNNNANSDKSDNSNVDRSASGGDAQVPNYPASPPSAIQDPSSAAYGIHYHQPPSYQQQQYQLPLVSEYPYYPGAGGSTPAAAATATRYPPPYHQQQPQSSPATTPYNNGDHIRVAYANNDYQQQQQPHNREAGFLEAFLPGFIFFLLASFLVSSEMNEKDKQASLMMHNLKVKEDYEAWARRQEQALKAKRKSERQTNIKGSE